MRKSLFCLVVSIIALPAVRDKLTQQGMDIGASTPEVFAKFVSGEMGRWGKVVRDNKIRAGEYAPARFPSRIAAAEAAIRAVFFFSTTSG